MKNNNKKAIQLGMPIGTASGKLRKSIIFMLLKMLNLNYCYQCGSEIESEKELSIEHKIPYLDSEDPVKMFFDLSNIAFSHLSCNVAAARKTLKMTGLDDQRLLHGSVGTYDKHGCRCNLCKEAKVIKNSKRYAPRKL
jgi:hypothetical protein